MDLRNPTDRSNVIEVIFTAACRQVGIHPTPPAEAIKPLVDPGQEFPVDALAEVDLNRLHEALRAVAEAMLQNSIGSALAPRFNQSAVSRALKSSTCHYLWFC